MNQLVYTFRWCLAIQAFGLAALPLCGRVFRCLPDRGYGSAKAFGLLLAGWVFWILVSLAGLPSTAGSIVESLFVLLVAGVILAGRSCRDWPRRSLPDLRQVVVVEVVFALAFAVWCLVRAYMPQIQTAGGEKWMEIAFLRAILRSGSFPPHDPWLSGFGISYYYFGYILIAMLTRLASVPPSIAFNLGVATIFALASSGAYSLAYNLLAWRQRGGESLDPQTAADGWLSLPSARRGALLGPLFLVLLGNLEGLLEVLHSRGFGSTAFWSWLDIRSINGAVPAVADRAWFPTRFFWWWQASRVLRDYAPWGDPQEIIDEFPAFSFILGDLHPHVLALPFVLLTISLALHVYVKTIQVDWGRDEPRQLPLERWELPIYAVCLGGLGFLNTWDFPVYALVLAVAYGAAAILFRHERLRDVLGTSLRLLVVVVVFGVIAYLPFWIGFQSQAGGILLNVFNPTRLRQFVVMFGPLLAVILPFVGVGLHRERTRVGDVAWWGVRTVLVTAAVSAGLLLILAILAGMVWLGILPAHGTLVYVDAWLRGAPIPGLETVPDAHDVIRRSLLSHLYTPWTALLLIGVVVGVVGRLLGRKRGVCQAQAGRVFALMLIGVGALLAVSVEFIYLRDTFGTRMNTVFKFYFQTWVLWGIAGAYGLAVFIRERRAGWSVIGSLFVMAGLVYPVLAIPARAREYGGAPTLDGTAYLSEVHPDDYAAIQWLNANVAGSPVVLEAPGDKFAGYVYEGRISANTGLPTVLGWAGHEYQWRGNYEEQARREPDIERLYVTSSTEEALMLLDRYDISYVYVGPLERQRYPAAGLDKFASLLDTVYDTGTVTIYHR